MYRMRILNGLLESELVESAPGDISGRVAQVRARATSLDGNLTREESQVGDIEDEVSSLESAMTGLESRMSELNGRVGALEGGISRAAEGVRAIEASAVALESRVTALEESGSQGPDIPAELTARVTTLESTASSLASALSTARSDITLLSASLTSFDTRLSAVEQAGGGGGGGGLADASTFLESVAQMVLEEETDRTEVCESISGRVSRLEFNTAGMGALAGYGVSFMSQSAYDALASKDASTFYFIVDASASRAFEEDN